MTGLARRLERRWYAPLPPPLPLRPLAWTYGALVALRSALYRHGFLRSERLPVPVIVVGNLTAGGAGKTPLTIAVATWLAGQGRRPGVISRGHGRRGRDARIVGECDTADEVGDEPLLVAAAGFPIAVAPRRADAARLLLAAHDCDMLIADDGLQHYALARDIEILVVDGRRGYGNRALLPAGPLREPPARAARCDLVVVNGGAVGRHHRADAGLPATTTSAQWCPPTEVGTETDTEIDTEIGIGIGTRTGTGAHAMRLEVEAARPLAGDGAAVPLSRFAGGQVHAVAGIGDPARFFDTLRAHGIEPVEHPFSDHHPYAADELRFSPPLPVLMTSKDAVKCRPFARADWYEVPVRAVLPDAFFAALGALLGAASPLPPMRPH